MATRFHVRVPQSTPSIDPPTPYVPCPHDILHARCNGCNRKRCIPCRACHWLTCADTNSLRCQCRSTTLCSHCLKQDTDTIECTGCTVLLCDICSIPCQECERWMCRQCESHGICGPCTTCMMCQGYMNERASCHACDAVMCVYCTITCPRCEARTCDECVRTCERCDRDVCGTCMAGGKVCSACM